MALSTLPRQAAPSMQSPQGEENAYRRFIIFQVIHPRPKGLCFLAWIPLKGKR